MAPHTHEAGHGQRGMTAARKQSQQRSNKVRSQDGRAWPTPRGSQRVVGSVGQYGGGL